MAKHIKIFTFLLLTKISLFGQVSFSIQVFHRHYQTCHIVGTTEDDYIILLDADSTIKIIKYSSNFHDQYNTIMKQTYVGSYSKNGDTIRAQFSGYSSTIKNKIGQTSLKYSARNVDTLFNSDSTFQYPSATYIVNADRIISTDNLIPTLPTSSMINIKMLESRFMNWDKNSGYKKKVLGLPK